MVYKMSVQQTSSQIYYNYLYRHGLDEKRRIQIPAKWRPADEGMQFTLILWTKPKEGPCLRVLPPQKMADLLASIDALPTGDPKKIVLKRQLGTASDQVTLDKAGRICVPEEMAKAAGIEIGSDAVLTGLFDHFEIWNPDRYAKTRVADEVMSTDALSLMD
jgi:MraZ protein